MSKLQLAGATQTANFTCGCLCQFRHGTYTEPLLVSTCKDHKEEDIVQQAAECIVGLCTLTTDRYDQAFLDQCSKPKD